MNGEFDNSLLQSKYSCITSTTRVHKDLVQWGKEAATAAFYGMGATSREELTPEIVQNAILGVIKVRMKVYVALLDEVTRHMLDEFDNLYHSSR